MNKKVTLRPIFAGELMTCIMCGAQQRRDLQVESQWRAIQMDGDDVYYACPAEFPPDPASKSDYTMAYQLILTKIMLERTRAAGGDIQRLEQRFLDLCVAYQLYLAGGRKI